jgi:hypothetical protein
MTQILDPLPPEQTSKILCCYVNATSQIQIARISNIPDWYFERVIFPGQRLFFDSVKEAVLEIHTGMMASAILSDKIPCLRLRVEEEDNDDTINIVEPSEEKTVNNKHNMAVENQKIKQTAARLTPVTVG